MQDPSGQQQGPFPREDVLLWLEQGYFTSALPLKLADAPPGTPFTTLGDMQPLWQQAQATGQDVRSLWQQQRQQRAQEEQQQQLQEQQAAAQKLTELLMKQQQHAQVFPLLHSWMIVGMGRRMGWLKLRSLTSWGAWRVTRLSGPAACCWAVLM